MNSTTTVGAGNFARQLYQLWKAMRDPSIPWAVKWLVPLVAFVYWLSPIDLIPFNPLDDIVVVLIALNVFSQMIARYQTSNAENQRAGASERQGANNGQPNSSFYNDNQTIETTWRVIKD